MKPPDATEPSARESETTGLPWPRTWPGVYLIVLASFILWVVLLVALTDCFA
jgi:hypothetical protein